MSNKRKHACDRLTEQLKRIKVDDLYSDDWGCIVENPAWSDEEDAKIIKPQNPRYINSEQMSIQ